MVDRRSNSEQISPIPREAHTYVKRVKRVNNECLMNDPSSSSLNSSTYK
jgi:hypothetical protein